jgi:hypothetical protein
MLWDHFVWSTGVLGVIALAALVVAGLAWAAGGGGPRRGGDLGRPWLRRWRRARTGAVRHGRPSGGRAAARPPEARRRPGAERPLAGPERGKPAEPAAERSDGYEGWLDEPNWRGDIHEPSPYPF